MISGGAERIEQEEVGGRSQQQHSRTPQCRTATVNRSIIHPHRPQKISRYKILQLPLGSPAAGYYTCNRRRLVCALIGGSRFGRSVRRYRLGRYDTVAVVRISRSRNFVNCQLVCAIENTWYKPTKPKKITLRRLLRFLGSVAGVRAFGGRSR